MNLGGESFQRTPLPTNNNVILAFPERSQIYLKEVVGWGLGWGIGIVMSLKNFQFITLGKIDGTEF